MGRGYGMIAVICCVMVLFAGCKYAPLDGLKSSAPNPQESAASFPHERRAALATDAWGGMRVDWTAVADWPVGDTPVAKSAREWIENRLRNYSREPFKGDVADWDAMTRFYGKQFLAESGQEKIEWHWRRCDMEGVSPHPKAPDVDPGVDVFLGADPRWFRHHSAIIMHEDERIVSYRSGFYGFFVGNVTSAAYVKCATFRKPDGKIIGWDAFADTNAVCELVRTLTKIKFKEGADYAGVGVIPVPPTPLFTADGIWCFWGDYAIVHGHAYELDGAFPSLFIPWRDPTCGGLLPDKREAGERLLTAEARTSLGLDKPKANR